MFGLIFGDEVVRCSGVKERTNGLAIDENTYEHEHFPCKCWRLAHKCTKALERTIAVLEFLRSRCVLALELCHEGIKRLFLQAITHLMRAITNEAWASRLGQLLGLTLPALAAMRLFLAPFLAIVVAVLMAISPTYIVSRPLVFE